MRILWKSFPKFFMIPIPFIALAIFSLTHLFPMHPFSTPLKYKKILRFSDIFGGRKRVHWEQMGYYDKVSSKYVPKCFDQCIVILVHY